MINGKKGNEKMEDIRQGIGNIYQEYTGKLYQIITVGTLYQTKEEYVVLQEMFGRFQSVIYPVNTFLEEMQGGASGERIRRFEKVFWGTRQVNLEDTVAVCSSKDVFSGNSRTVEGKECVSIDDMLFEFLDAETSLQKIDILTRMRPRLDERTINNIAASMDLPSDEKDIERQYEFIMQNLRQRSKFECDRFR